MLALHRFEPNAESLALLICLEELGVDYEDRYVDMLRLEQHGPGHIDLGAGPNVPVLLAEGEALGDAMLALQYLTDAHRGAGLAPGDAAGWYDAQAWLAWLGGWQGLAADIRLLGWNYVMRDALSNDALEDLQRDIGSLDLRKEAGWGAVWSDAEAPGEQLALSEERVSKHIARIEAALAGSGWIVGSDYSIVDIAAFAYLHNVADLLPALANDESSPRLLDLVARIAVRPAAKAAMTRKRSTVADVVYAPPGT